MTKTLTKTLAAALLALVVAGGDVSRPTRIRLDSATTAAVTIAA